MFTLLFDSGFWYDIIFIAVAIGLIYLCFKYKSAKYYVGTLAIVALLGVTGYCGIQLNAYYTSEGGIFGHISGLIKPNTGTVTISDKIEFSLTNIVMTEQLDGTYSAKIYLSDVAELKEGKSYIVLVNDEPCTKNEFSTGSTSYMRAEYAYSFLDNELNTLCTDNLIFNISFFDKSTEITVSSKGGQTAVDYWSTYFNKNNVEVSIVPSEYTRDNEIEYGEGDYSNYATITYMVDDSMYLTQVYEKSQMVTLVTAPEKTGYVFKYWKDENGTKVNDSSKFSSNKTLTAVYYEIVTATLFEGEKEIWIGDGQTVYTDYVVLNLSSYFDIDFLNTDFEVKFDFSIQSQSGESAGANVMTFKPGDSYAIESTYGTWGELSLSSNGVFKIALTNLFDVYNANFNIYSITTSVELPEAYMDGEYLATASYQLQEMGFTEECTIEIQFEISDNKLANYTYTVSPNFDFEDVVGLSYEEYLKEAGETSEFSIDASQEANKIVFTVAGLFRTGETIEVQFDYISQTWSILNNLSASTTSNIVKAN